MSTLYLIILLAVVAATLLTRRKKKPDTARRLAGGDRSTSADHLGPTETGKFQVKQRLEGWSDRPSAGGSAAGNPPRREPDLPDPFEVSVAGGESPESSREKKK